MRNIKTLSIIGLILLIIGIIGATFTFERPLDRSDWTPLEKEIKDNTIENIKVLADNADIEVLSTTDEAIKIEVLGSDPENDLSTSVKDSALLIDLKHQRNKLFRFNLFSSVSSLKVYVPEKMYESIRIESDNGRIKSEGLQAKELNVETDNGLIELRSIESSSVSAQADNGKILLEDIEGKLFAKTDNGAITLLTSHLDRPIELTTDNGSIDVQTEQEPTSAVFDVKVDLGKISIFGDSNGNKKIGDGEHLIKLRTDIGRVIVKKSM